ncbi:hypothetical protein CBR_g40456 [Chara braunii]|uniref:Uncharacterized protein n=1 Tax=Chara braunii TaxID=69332 RepID=A0A388LTZ5_CHABU|nr:hypothetical protein CBR_g40456 [Chara braunii]|eukprot:GBG85729.1 hypothetical protein CBR_g40456 [Chara braunii]
MMWSQAKRSMNLAVVAGCSCCFLACLPVVLPLFAILAFLVGSLTPPLLAGAFTLLCLYEVLVERKAVKKVNRAVNADQYIKSEDEPVIARVLDMPVSKGRVAQAVRRLNAASRAVAAMSGKDGRKSTSPDSNALENGKCKHGDLAPLKGGPLWELRETSRGVKRQQFDTPHTKVEKLEMRSDQPSPDHRVAVATSLQDGQGQTASDKPQKMHCQAAVSNAQNLRTGPKGGKQQHHTDSRAEVDDERTKMETKLVREEKVAMQRCVSSPVNHAAVDPQDVRNTHRVLQRAKAVATADERDHTGTQPTKHSVSDRDRTGLQVFEMEQRVKNVTDAEGEGKIQRKLLRNFTDSEKSVMRKMPSGTDGLAWRGAQGMNNATAAKVAVGNAAGSIKTMVERGPLPRASSERALGKSSSNYTSAEGLGKDARGSEIRSSKTSGPGAAVTAEQSKVRQVEVDIPGVAPGESECTQRGLTEDKAAVEGIPLSIMPCCTLSNEELSVSSRETESDEVVSTGESVGCDKHTTSRRWNAAEDAACVDAQEDDALLATTENVAMVGISLYRRQKIALSPSLADRSERSASRAGPVFGCAGGIVHIESDFNHGAVRELPVVKNVKERTKQQQQVCFHETEERPSDFFRVPCSVTRSSSVTQQSETKTPLFLSPTSQKTSCLPSPKSLRMPHLLVFSLPGGSQTDVEVEDGELEEQQLLDFPAMAVDDNEDMLLDDATTDLWKLHVDEKRAFQTNGLLGREGARSFSLPPFPMAALDSVVSKHWSVERTIPAHATADRETHSFPLLPMAQTSGLKPRTLRASGNDKVDSVSSSCCSIADAKQSHEGFDSNQLQDLAMLVIPPLEWNLQHREPITGGLPIPRRKGSPSGLAVQLPTPYLLEVVKSFGLECSPWPQWISTSRMMLSFAVESVRDRECFQRVCCARSREPDIGVVPDMRCFRDTSVMFLRCAHVLRLEVFKFVQEGGELGRRKRTVREEVEIIKILIGAEFPNASELEDTTRGLLGKVCLLADVLGIDLLPISKSKAASADEQAEAGLSLIKRVLGVKLHWHEGKCGESRG